MELREVEELYQQRLKESGRHLTRSVRLILQVFIASSEPLSPMDLLYAVKKFDPLVSLFTVARAMKSLVKCGLAVAIAPDRNRQAVRYGKPAPGGADAASVQIGVCNHRHLVCKDCGKTIEPETEVL